MLKIPGTDIHSCVVNHSFTLALRAKGWTDELSQKVIDNPKLAELLVEIVKNSEEFERLKEI